MTFRNATSVAVAFVGLLTACGGQAASSPRAEMSASGPSPSLTASPTPVGSAGATAFWIGTIDQDAGGCGYSPAGGRVEPGRLELTVLNNTDGPGAFDLFRIGPGGTLEGLNAAVYDERRLAEAGEPFGGPPSWARLVSGSGSLDANEGGTIAFDAEPGMYAAVCLSAYADTPDPFRPAFLAGPITVSDEISAARQGSTDTFLKPFSYELPADAWIDVFPLSDHLHGFAFDGLEAGGMAVWVVDATLADPCLPASEHVAFEGGAAGLIERVRSVEAIEVTGESATTIDGHDAVTLELAVGDTGCTARSLHLWPDTSHDESDWTMNMPHDSTARIHVFELAGSTLVIEEFGFDTASAQSASSVLASIDFSDAP